MYAIKKKKKKRILNQSLWLFDLEIIKIFYKNLDQMYYNHK